MNAHSKDPSTDIVEAVATATGQDALALPPLAEYVDPEALNTLLSANSNTTRGGVQISFAYASFRVTAERDDSLEIRLEPTDRE